MLSNIKKSDIERKYLLAIDYGRKYTGLAHYRVGIDPFILKFGRIKYESDDQLIDEIIKVLGEEFMDIVVCGIPFFTDGKASTMTKTIQDFATKLKAKLDVPLYLQNETLTTFEAEERMKNDPQYNFKVDYTQIDAVAATIILEEFVNNSSDE